MAQGFPPPPLFKEIQPIADGYLLLTRNGVFDHFGQDLTPAEKELVLAAQGATQGAILATPIGKAAWHSKPSWFVIASNDHAIAPEQEASTAERMGSKTLTLASSHLPMLSQPDKVAAFIIEAAGSLGEKATSA